jgi:hypothetical protein
MVWGEVNNGGTKRCKRGHDIKAQAAVTGPTMPKNSLTIAGTPKARVTSTLLAASTLTGKPRICSISPSPINQ